LGFNGVAGNRQVSLTWSPAIAATGYKLRWSANAAGPYTQLTGNLTTNSFVHATAVNGQTNYYQVATFTECGTGNYSPALGVLLPLPTLSVSATSNTLTLSWPDWANDWLLRSATNLTPPITWWPVTNTPVSSNGQFIATLPFRYNTEFFRLISP